ncbi:hypothetical protein GPECTOR_119g407 [Gonium pectorale]|uniref:Major facilitator superfamily (MFS) profile domain-containing protein n=1 Tax=Gonium pectorale TaxID=33097 RepID=A0A150FYS6_GONPE|nr:hypothetical protein GPECTOR_119g407 [Gonium pectorale]|eukprot:KXZ42776.1 hypothetical protein GPECTOR_119g407 [Gonium pectorale]
MGAIKFVRDIASFGIIFWAPTIVNALLQEMRDRGEGALDAGDATAEGAGSGLASHGARRLAGAVMMSGHGHGHGGTGTAAVLLTALPFALAAAFGMALAHSSQRRGERFLHIALPYIIAGSVLVCYSGAATRSPWLGFAALSLGVVGVYGGSGPSLSLLSELAAGPGLVVALPLYNSLGTLGGFLGPSVVGLLLQRSAAAQGAAGHAPSAGGGFGPSAVMMGSAMILAGALVLMLGASLGRLGDGLWGPHQGGLAPCPGAGLARSRSDGGAGAGGESDLEVVVLESSGHSSRSGGEGGRGGEAGGARRSREGLR